MYLGIDIGTSSVKAVLVDAAQRVAGEASAPLEVSRPHPLWSEQDPQHWWQGVERALDGLAADRGLAGLRGIGLSGQMHGAVCLDAADAVLRPAILWNDGRSAAECSDFEARAPDSRRIAGNAAMAGFTAPKLLWIARHEPEIFARIARVLLPKDYVRLRLTGAHVTDMSDAAGTLWLDVGARDWSDDLLAATGLSRGQMPELVEGSEVSGHLRPSLASRWGIEAKVPVAGGAGDNAAAACGMGVIAPGRALVSLGTSGVLFVATAAFAANPSAGVHAFCHALPATWHQMGVILSAADSLAWLGRVTGRAPADLVEAVPPVASPSAVTFLPYLSGERTPHADTAARGAFVGLAQAHGTADLTQAVLEGVAYAFADCRDALAGAGTDFETALAVGGGASSPTWLAILANVLDRPLEVPADSGLGAALGAARLAICAAEGADPAEVCQPPATVRRVDPDPGLAAAYRARHARYRALYPALRSAGS